MKSIYTLLLLTWFACSCNEQEKKSSAGEPGIFPKSQVSSYIRNIYQDRHGNLWMGTTQDGVCRYDPSAAGGSGALTYYTRKDGFAGVCVKAIAEDKAGNLWFATEGGVSRFDGKDFTNFTVKNGLIDNDVWSILIDRTGIIWFGTMGGVSRYDPSASSGADSKSFENFSLPSADVVSTDSRFSPNSVVSICQDKAGNIWFGTNGSGVRRYDPALAGSSNAFTIYTDKDGLGSNNVWCIMEDRGGNIWFGTRGGGACRYDPLATHTKGTATFTCFTQKDGLPGNNISAIIQDRTGNIWFGTSGGGVSLYDPSATSKGAKPFTTITEKDGITQNHVQSIYEDKSGNIWVGFSGGLFRIDENSPSGGQALLTNITKDGPWQ